MLFEVEKSIDRTPSVDNSINNEVFPLLNMNLNAVQSLGDATTILNTFDYDDEADGLPTLLAASGIIRDNGMPPAQIEEAIRIFNNPLQRDKVHDLLVEQVKAVRDFESLLNEKENQENSDRSEKTQKNILPEEDKTAMVIDLSDVSAASLFYPDKQIIKVAENNGTSSVPSAEKLADKVEQSGKQDLSHFQNMTALFTQSDRAKKNMNTLFSSRSPVKQRMDEISDCTSHSKYSRNENIKLNQKRIDM